MMKTTRLFLTGAFALCMCLSALADPIDVGDHSFETNAEITGPGGWSNNIGPEWTGLNGQNDGAAFEEYIDGFSADGTNHVGMGPEYSLWQDLPETFQANSVYTLQVAIGNRSGQTGPANETIYSLGDGSTIFATMNVNVNDLTGPGTFVDAPALILDTSLDSSAVGQPIRITLGNGADGRSHYDNIRLDVTAVPEPETALMAIFGMVVCLLGLRRR